MKLILHIGTEKTGSTSIQRWLRDNRQTLLNNKIWVCSSLGPVNHVGLYVYATSKRTESIEPYMLSTLNLPEISAEDPKGVLKDRIEKEIYTARAEGADIFVISNEHCQGRLDKAEEIQKLHDLLTPNFTSCEVICLLRPQVDAIISMVSTQIRYGKPIRPPNLADRLGIWRPKYDYYGSVSRWEAIFGRESIRLSPYVRTNPIQLFETVLLGLSQNATAYPKRQNEKLSAKGIGLANALFRPEDSMQLRTLLFSYIARTSKGEGLKLPRALMAQIQSHYREGNLRIVEMFPDLKLSDLEVDLEAFSEEGNVNVLAEMPEFNDDVRHLVVALANDLAASRRVR